MTDDYMAVHATRPWHGDDTSAGVIGPENSVCCKQEVVDVCLNCTQPDCTGEECEAYKSVYKKVGMHSKVRSNPNRRLPPDSKIYTFNGESHSVRAWANISGVKYSTLKSRLLRGMPFERAIQAGDLRDTNGGWNARLYTMNGETHSLIEWAKISGLRAQTIAYRLDRGIPIEDAIRDTDLRKFNRFGKDDQMADAVNHPAHYNAGTMEVIDAIEGLGMGKDFNRGNAIKYICRAGLKSKDTEVEDLNKAIWYIQREIQRVQNGGVKLNGEEKKD